MNNVEPANALLSVVKEIYDGGKDIIGPRWTVLAKMTVLAQNADIPGMVRYFENSKRSEKGQGVRRRLERAGRKTLESEEARFMDIARGTPRVRTGR
jgi:hypothetical protein